MEHPTSQGLGTSASAGERDAAVAVRQAGREDRWDRGQEAGQAHREAALRRRETERQAMANP